MGWVWKNDDDADSYPSAAGNIGEFLGSSSTDDDGGRRATRKVVKSQCRTEEVEPGKFIRKCEKTEQVFRDCVGRPTEMVQSNKEYTEEDVTDQMVQGSFSFKSSENEPSFFPGLRSDIEAMERDFFGGVAQFFQAAQDVKKEFFKSVGVPHTYDDEAPSSYKKSVGVPHTYDDEAPSSYKKPGIHIEGRPPKEDFSKKTDGDVDLSGLARDV